MIPEKGLNFQVTLQARGTPRGWEKYLRYLFGSHTRATGPGPLKAFKSCQEVGWGGGHLEAGRRKGMCQSVAAVAVGKYSASVKGKQRV